MKKTLKNKLWKKIIQNKIQNQYINTKEGSLKSLVVKPGDIQNREGFAAQVYWKTMFKKEYESGWRREQIGCDNLNILLNYAYTILRNVHINYILAIGLEPRFSLFHCHPTNNQPLADDLMEPFRPFIDYHLKQLPYQKNMDYGMKARITKIFGEKLIIGNKEKTLQNAIKTHCINYKNSFLTDQLQEITFDAQ